jgi:hypothetical protein
MAQAMAAMGDADGAGLSAPWPAHFAAEARPLLAASQI